MQIPAPEDAQAPSVKGMLLTQILLDTENHFDIIYVYKNINAMCIDVILLGNQ